jgi:antitoxin VapB
MGLNIKNARVHELARRAAARTGRSQTSVIEQALERLLAELDSPVADDPETSVRRVLDDVDRRLTDDARTALLTDVLYDESGLPA